MNLSISSISFQSRKPQIRKADDLMRKSKQIFDVFSPGKHYKTMTSSNSPKLNRYNQGILRAVSNLSHLRKDTEGLYDTLELDKVLKEIKKARLGNCFEQALSLVCFLRAKGYTSARLESLAYCASYKNCKTNEIIQDSIKDADHAFVALNMDDRKVILDPWLEECGFEDEMLAKYKRIFERKINDIKARRIEINKNIHNAPFVLNKEALAAFENSWLDSVYLDHVDFKKIQKSLPEINR